MDIVLKNDQLEVTMHRPGEGYAGSRFDWTAFITQVTYEGHTFCTAEQILPERESTLGEGLCAEFGLNTPISYGEISPGEWFPKIGIGKMKKPFQRPDGRYPHTFNFEKITGCFECQPMEDSVYFRALPVPVNGYAFDLEKKVSLEHNALILEYTLKNVGEKELHTHEYVHNFLAVDGLPLSPEYRMRMPFRYKKGTVDHPDVRLADDGFTFRRAPETTVMLLHPESFSADVSWELTHAKQRVGMREMDFFEVAQANVWCQEHVVAPEFFYAVNLKPGETAQWCRRFEWFRF